MRWPKLLKSLLVTNKDKGNRINIVKAVDDLIWSGASTSEDMALVLFSRKLPASVIDMLTNLPLLPHICVSKLGQHWFSAKPLPEPVLTYCQLELTSVKFESKYNIFRSQNAFVNVVCEMTAILSRGRCVNPYSRVAWVCWALFNFLWAMMGLAIWHLHPRKVITKIDVA